MRGDKHRVKGQARKLFAEEVTQRDHLQVRGNIFQPKPSVTGIQLDGINPMPTFRTEEESTESTGVNVGVRRNQVTFLSQTTSLSNNSITYFNGQKVEPTFVGQSLGYHGLGAAWWSVEQHPLGWLDSHASEGLRVPQRPLNSLLQFQLHLLHAAYIRPANLEKGKFHLHF